MDGRFSYTNAINAFENDDFPTYFAIFTKAVRTNGLRHIDYSKQQKKKICFKNQHCDE